MKRYFIVSLIKNGILGGVITADTEAITYHSGKLTIEQKYRHLVMRYKDIREVEAGWLFILPTVTVKMKKGEDHKFAVFFSRKRFIDTLKEMGADV